MIAGDRSKLLAAFISAAVLPAANKLRRLALCAFIPCPKLTVYCFPKLHILYNKGYYFLPSKFSLYIGKITKFSRNSTKFFGHIFKLHQMLPFLSKMLQNRWRLGLRPRPRWGSLQRSPRPLAVGGGRGTGRGRGRGGDGRGRQDEPPWLESWIRPWIYVSPHRWVQMFPVSVWIRNMDRKHSR